MLHYEETAPCTALREYVECYWVLRTDQSLKEELCLPDGSASLIFNFGPDYLRATCSQPNARTSHGRCTLPHQGRESVLITQQAPVRVLGARFKPYGMAPFYRVSMAELSPGFVLQGAALAPFIGNLEELLFATEDFGERIRRLEAFLLERLPLAAPPDELVKNAVLLMVRSEGNLRISDLLEQLCVSKSSLEKKFQEAVGLSPKIVCNILRFNSLVYQQRQHPYPTLTELTYNQGFFDQAHLVHNFKAFTGLPPGRFFRQDNRLVEILRQSFEARVSEIY